MIDTEALTPEDRDALNNALRGANVTEEDIKQIAAEMQLGEGTVRRWFDATNGGDYSEAIPVAALGKEAYQLQANLADEQPDHDLYPEAPDAYESDEGPDIDNNEGIADPSEESLFERELMAALLTSEGYTRERSTETTSGREKHDFGFSKVFSSLYGAVEYAQGIIEGSESAFLAIAWSELRCVQRPDGSWFISVDYYESQDGDPSP